MPPFTEITEYFETFLPFSEMEKNLIQSKIQARNVKRKELILSAGTVCSHYTFVVSGCLKMYHLDEKGIKHNIQFAAEKDWIADIGSFHSGKKSQMNIEALEHSNIIEISQSDLYELYTSIPKLDRVFKVIIENKFVELQNRVLQNIGSTAQQRYLAFLEQYPNLILRLPSTQIASYLGITPEFLSQIRRDITNK